MAALFPARIYIYLAIALGVFAAGGTAAWQIQNRRITNIKADHTQAIAAATAKVAAAELANQIKITEAQNVRIKKETAIQAGAAAVRTARYGLRDTTSAFVGKATPSTCNERSKIVAVVFDQCAGALTELAETTDRIESDRQLLLDSWPK